MKYLLYFLLLLNSINSIYCQKNDYYWVIGKHSNNPNTIYKVGINIFNFNNDPVNIIESDDYVATFDFTCSLINKKNGELGLVSNGMHILDSISKPIMNGEKINYNEFWKLFKSTYYDKSERLGGLRISQGMLMLPWPDKDSIMWICPNYQIVNNHISGDYTKGLFFGIVDVSNENPKVILKDSLITTDTITPNGITACRHANGRDWWIIVGNHNRSKLYTYLFDPSGLQRVHTTATSLDYIFGLGQAVFSPLGDKFVIYEVIGAFGFLDQGHFSIFDFDRCTGELSQHRYKPFVGGQFLVGCAISNDGRYLYTSNLRDLHQYDLQANDIMASEQLVAVGDRFHSYYNHLDSVENYFTFMQLAPDGKIYSPGGNTQHMHRMEYPDEAGEACTMNQHVLHTVSNSSTIPNMPFYRLGPEDGSDCDSLDLDNHPIAKFRYEQDTTNHLNLRFTDLSYFRPETWHWDFGDGATFEGRKPYWHEFPKNGTYNVCLTVSNENSEHTMCRLVNIGSTSNEELKMKNEKLVSLFPNPTEGEVLLTLSDYIPEEGMVYVYDMMGKEVYKQRVYYGWNNVNLIHLSNGQYMYQVFDKKNKISHGKLIKI